MATQVQEIRNRLGMSQTEMAGVLGLSLRAYQDIEAGASKERSSHVLAARFHALERTILQPGVQYSDDERIAAYARDRIRFYLSELETAHRSVELIDSGALKTHAATLDLPMHDTTSATRQRMIDQIVMMEEAIKLWRMRLPAAENSLPELNDMGGLASI